MNSQSVVLLRPTDRRIHDFPPLQLPNSPRLARARRRVGSWRSNRWPVEVTFCAAQGWPVAAAAVAAAVWVDGANMGASEASARGRWVAGAAAKPAGPPIGRDSC